MMNNVGSLMQMLGQMKQNPQKFLSQRFNIPENIGNDPQNILQHLLNSGQVSQSQINSAMQARKFFTK